MSRGGVTALCLRARTGLADLRRGSGEVGVGALDLFGSSMMYMGVSKSRNSTVRGQRRLQRSSNNERTRRLWQACNDIIIARKVHGKVTLQSCAPV